MADTALVTGGTGGIGSAIVAKLAQTGANVAIHFRNNETAVDVLLEQVRSLGRKGMAVQADFNFQDVDGLSRMVINTVTEQLAAPNTVVLTASAQDVTPWEELNAETWDHVYANTIRMTAAMIQATAANMLNHPHPNKSIIVLGSIEGIRPAANHAPYATMKAATHHLVTAAAHELGRHGIRVVGIAPGLVDRHGLREDWPQGVASFEKTAALGRVVTPREIAETVAWLSSPAASAITGVTIPVDAGWSSHPGW